MSLPRPAARDRDGESRGGRSGLSYYLPCLPPIRFGAVGRTIVRNDHIGCVRVEYLRNRSCSGANPRRLPSLLSARVGTSLSLRAVRRTVGGNVPAARG